MENQAQLEALHSENLGWLKNLVFYTEDIKSMQSRIEDIASEYSSSEVMANIEHFQNQLEIQKKEYNILKHSLKNNQRLLLDALTNYGGLSSQIISVNHSRVKEKVIIFEKIINDLQVELKQFLQVAI